MYKEYCWRNLNVRSRWEYLRVEGRVADPGGRAIFWVCGRSLAGIAGSNPAGSMNVSCECYVLSLVQRSPTECGASDSNLETSNTEEA